MKKRLFIVLTALLAAPLCVKAQKPHTETTQSVSLSIPLGAGLHYAYEHPLARRITLIGRVGADAGAAWRYNLLNGDRLFWVIAPSVDIEPRFYYGLDRREAHGRSTEKNAGSFFALQMKNIMPFGYISDSDMKIVGATGFTPMWGLRRVWGAGWLFECTAGASLAWGWEGGFQSSPHLGVRFGYSF